MLFLCIYTHLCDVADAYIVIRRIPRGPPRRRNMSSPTTPKIPETRRGGCTPRDSHTLAGLVAVYARNNDDDDDDDKGARRGTTRGAVARVMIHAQPSSFALLKKPSPTTIAVAEVVHDLFSGPARMWARLFVLSIIVECIA